MLSIALLFLLVGRKGLAHPFQTCVRGIQGSLIPVVFISIVVGYGTAVQTTPVFGWLVEQMCIRDSPLPGVDAEGNEIVFDKDQGIRRDTTLEKMASMKPCFRENGRVTAATSSQTSDGAAFLVLMSRDKAAEMGIRPLASFLGFCVGGLDPAYMGLGPIYAAPKVLEYTGLTMDDMDVIELNEAFAAQVSPCIRELGMDPARVNPNGGAMALGHPLGATGAVLSCKAISELRCV